MQKIGKGNFTSAYLKKDGRVLLKSRDKVKACMSERFFPKSKLFPKIKRVYWHEWENILEDITVYEMKYYPKLTKPSQQLNYKHYRLYKLLRNVRATTREDLMQEFRKLPVENYIISALCEAVNAISNYDCNVVFEISPRNVSYTPSGRLILLDCFFIYSDIRR